MAESQGTASVRLSKPLLKRIDATAKQLGLTRSDFLRGLIAKAMDAPEAIANEAVETTRKLDDLVKVIEHMDNQLTKFAGHELTMREGMATLAAVMATVNGRTPDEARAWARSTFLNQKANQ